MLECESVICIGARFAIYTNISEDVLGRVKAERDRCTKICERESCVQEEQKNKEHIIKLFLRYQEAGKYICFFMI